MTQSMINTLTERINEMVKNVEIQKIMMSFKSNEEGQEWIIKSAIATLIVKQ